jgi:hypothetical protein
LKVIDFATPRAPPSKQNSHTQAACEEQLRMKNRLLAKAPTCEKSFFFGGVRKILGAQIEK